MPILAGYYRTYHIDPQMGEVWELLIEQDEQQHFAFQLYTHHEYNEGYSESSCEGQVEFENNQFFFKEQIGYHWEWKDTNKQYHLIEIKHGFKGTLDAGKKCLKIATIELNLSEDIDLEALKQRFLDVKQQLSELLIIKGQYPTEFW